ncbi:hypothetical protein J6590_039503 [Homalodisca vitripennis]|nr:hypothetical protein J6590_039503 [Homalodisca vitripennis]
MPRVPERRHQTSTWGKDDYCRATRRGLSSWEEREKTSLVATSTRNAHRSQTHSAWPEDLYRSLSCCGGCWRAQRTGSVQDNDWSGLVMDLFLPYWERRRIATLPPRSDQTHNSSSPSSTHNNKHH